ncbi:MAG: 5-formyltetrahydrofolate cyclo-ligase [Spirosomaceae bacterium]|jgi:5-formyltetrahydrofolate cyclo-ligase|nr:5-formyltetrahydrofolate cyclo-ligase [Spirosomataceae bacterium]
MKMPKDKIRKKYKADRRNLTASQIRSASQRIHDWLFQSLPIHSYSNIHVFLPIKEQNEIDTWLIISTLQTDFSTHIIIPKSHRNGTLTNYRFTIRTQFEINQWGISEPVHNEQLLIKSEEIDMVLIPLLAFDKNGYRVGYGKGFYDRFLAECRPDVVKVGLSVFEPIDEITDLNEFDIKMDFCITPNRVWQF